MADQQQEKQWQKADDEVRKNLPPGVKLVRTLRSREEDIGGIAWSSDGQMLALVSARNNIELRDAETGECLQTLRAHDSSVWCVAFDPAGHILASGSYDETVKLWRFANGKSLHSLEDHNAGVCGVVFDPTGRTLISGSHDGTIKVWDVITGTCLRTLTGHTGDIYCVASDQAGLALASGGEDKTVRLWEATSGRLQHVMKGHKKKVFNVAFDPAGRTLASASEDKTIKIWSSADGRLLRTLEAHIGPVTGLKFLADGRIIASKGEDDAIRIWDAEAGVCLAVFPEESYSLDTLASLVSHPHLPLIAAVGTEGLGTQYKARAVIHVYELDYAVLLKQPAKPAVTYTSAKVVLVGDSGVGKTGLGWRLAHNEFKEHSSTHGQQFWLFEQLCKERSDGARCEAVLWDLAGQDDYRIIHSLFLDDADLALVLFDPTHHDDPLGGAEFWLKQLKASRKDGAATRIGLVAARSDRGTPRLTPKELKAFCKLHGIEFYLPTSAKAGEGIDKLIERMQGLIPWDDKPATITTETFKRIKDFVLGLKENRHRKKLILTPEELRQELVKTDKKWKFSDAEMLTAVGHLATHGYVTQLKTSSGESRILLAPELLNNLAASFVLQARRNRKGLGALEEERLLSGGYKFPELAKLAGEEKDMLADSAAALFLEHNVCFRETHLDGRAYLVFPELINLSKPSDADERPMTDGPAYTASGAVENVYASLVVLTGYTQTFTRTDQWRNQARYEVGPEKFVCGFRQEDERAGELDFVLYFGTNTPAHTRTLFQGLFESFLARRNLTVQRFEPVACPKGHVLNRGVVRERIAKRLPSAFCNECGEKIMLPKADKPIQLSKDQTAEVEADRRAADRRTRFEQALFRLKAHVTEQKIKIPECFISYAWGVPEHEHWVEKSLATDLQKGGINVLLDKWDNRKIGSSIPRFVSRIEKCDHLLVVGTPLYRQKTDNEVSKKGSVVAAEWDLAGIRMIATEAAKMTVLPLLLAGDESESFPALARGRVYADFRNVENYFNMALELMLNLYAIDLQDAVAVELLGSLSGKNHT